MTDAVTHGSSAPGDANERFAPFRASAAMAALAGIAVVVAARAGSDAAMAMLAPLLAFAGMAVGHLFGRRDGAATARASRLTMFRVADELTQYRAFTRLLRDQGGRIVESTSAAARMIIAELNEMDGAVDSMRLLIDRAGSTQGMELRSLVDAVGAPVIAVLGHLQFQDVTEQQITFLSRLSLILDEHMLALACDLGDRPSANRLGHFREMFEQALGDCVMDSQRDDHHAASGVDAREAVGAKLEMF